MSKHTPGPWQVTCIDGRTVEVVIHHVLRIASCGPKDDPENRANAALIACAPQLLACLQAAYNDVILSAERSRLAEQTLLADELAAHARTYLSIIERAQGEGSDP